MEFFYTLIKKNGSQVQCRKRVFSGFLLLFISVTFSSILKSSPAVEFNNLSFDYYSIQEELPKMVELGKKHKLVTSIMVTAIRDTTDPYAEDVLRTAFKDFTWGISGRKAKVVSVPPGERIIDFDLFFQAIKGLNIEVPITLRAEHSLLETAEEKLPLLKQQQIIVTKLKKDVEFIRINMAKFKLI
jgi:hypothetical protein